MSVTKGNKVKKQAMIEALTASLGVVSDACKVVGIARKTHYQWIKTDENYKEEVEGISEVALDFVESKMFEKIKSGDTGLICFYLKTQGKKRGYIEKQEVEHSGSNISINLIKG